MASKLSVFINAVIICIFLLLPVKGVFGATCSIVDSAGNTISTANPGEIVYFKSSYVFEKTKRAKWQLTIFLPSIDPSDNSMRLQYKGHYYHEGSPSEFQHVVPVLLPAMDFLEGTATFTYSFSLSKTGKCTVYLDIVPAEPDPDITPPSTPVNLQVSAVSSRRINLTWDPCTDNVCVTGYNIYKNGVFFKSVTGTSASDTGLSPSTQYCYCVSAFDASQNESELCGGVCDTTLSGEDTTPPTIPTGLQASAVSSSEIHLSWKPSVDDESLRGYKIYRDGAYLKSVTGSTTTDTGLSSSTQYCYRVSAYDAQGNESEPSGETCVTTSSTTPGQLWTFTTTFFMDYYQITLASYPDNRSFDISFAHVSGTPLICPGIDVFIQGNSQFNLSRYASDSNTALITWNSSFDGCSDIYPGQTVSAVISDIPAWFNFNSGFTIGIETDGLISLEPNGLAHKQ
jgi:chitodextrinase